MIGLLQWYEKLNLGRNETGCPVMADRESNRKMAFFEHCKEKGRAIPGLAYDA